MLRVIFTLFLLVSFIHIVPTNGKNNNKNKTIFSPRSRQPIVPGMISKILYSKRLAKCQRMESRGFYLEHRVEELRAHPVEEMSEEKTNEVIEMTTNNPNGSSTTNNLTLGYTCTNNSDDEEQRLRRELFLIDEENCQLQIDAKNLSKEINATHVHFYQFKWKVLMKLVMDEYEEHFEKLHLKYSQPSFQLDEPKLNDTFDYYEDSHFVEIRKQRWEFYLKTPPYCIYFDRLVKRIEKSDFTLEEFCGRMAKFYREISYNFYAVPMASRTMQTDPYLMDYPTWNFIVPLLLADYPRTKLIDAIFSELQSGKPPS